MQFDPNFDVQEFREDSYSEGKFDVKKFNKEYDKEMKKIQKNYNLKQKNLLDEYDKEANKKEITNLTSSQILINMKDTLFDIIKEITTLDFNGFDGFVRIFTKNDRLFYLGIFLLIVSFLFFLLSIGKGSENNEKSKKEQSSENVNIYLNLSKLGELENKKPDVITKTVHDKSNSKPSKQVNQPVTSNITNVPNQPNRANLPVITNPPNITNQPVITNPPNITNQPVTPNITNVPNQPVIPNQPNQPNITNVPNQPVIPNQPNQPNISNVPKQPGFSPYYSYYQKPIPRIPTLAHEIPPPSTLY